MEYLEDIIVTIRLNGHRYEHDLFELTRAFLPGASIRFIENEVPLRHVFRIESVFHEGKRCVVTTLKQDQKLIASNTLEASMFPWMDQIPNPDVKLIKKSLYQVLQSAFRRSLPWGTLTGIRPIKLVRSLFARDLSNSDTQQVLEELFELDPMKAKEAIEIGERQQRILEPVNPLYYSLYINIPFCPSICSYCSFPTLSTERYGHHIERYVEMLIRETEETIRAMAHMKLDTVYIGGGTPSVLPVPLLEKILMTVRSLVKDDIRECTVECGRADTLSDELLLMLEKNGVDRISINPQTFHEETLEKLGRNHTVDEVMDAFRRAKKHKIQIVNMDLILGLPDEERTHMDNTLDCVFSLRPENITLHALALKKGSRLEKEPLSVLGREADDMRALSDHAHQRIIGEGYIPYYLYRQKQMVGNLDNVGYALPGTEGIYNILSMEECQTILGIGMGAISKFYYPVENRIQRISNFKSLDAYFNRFSERNQKKLKEIEDYKTAIFQSL